MRTVLLLLLLLPGLLSHAQPTSPWSAGVMALTDSQPYRGADGRLRAFPFLSYRGPNLEWYGPLLRYAFARPSPWTLRATAQLDFAAYDEDDAPILRGLGDRDPTLLLGLSAETKISSPWTLRLGAERDALGRHEGAQAHLDLSRAIGSPRAPLSGALSAGLAFQDSRWTRDRVGVPSDKALPSRPAYSPGFSLHPRLAARLLYRLSPHASLSVGVRLELLDDTWRDSPLVSDPTRTETFLTLAFSF